MKQGRVMLEFLFSVLAALRVFVCSRSNTSWFAKKDPTPVWAER
jgi:hypothetical protein